MSEYKPPALLIIIPCFNNWNFTKACLKDLEKLPNDHKIIIVDNGSTDDTRTFESDEVIVIRHKENCGFAWACNSAAEHAFLEIMPDNIMFLNNDIRVRSDYDTWTKPIIEAAQSGSYLVGPTLGVLDSNFNFVRETKKLPNSGHVYMSGWNITASRKTWSKFNGSDPQPINHWHIWCNQYFAFFEDGDLSFEAQRRGIELKVVDCPVQHFGHATAKKMNISEMYKKSHAHFSEKWRKIIMEESLK